MRRFHWNLVRLAAVDAVVDIDVDDVIVVIADVVAAVVVVLVVQVNSRTTSL